MKTKLTDRQMELLTHMQVDPSGLAVFAKDERIPDWAALKKVMLALGGSWQRKGQGFSFPVDVDAEELIRLAKETGEILDPETMDFFPTPAAVVEQMLDLAELDHTVTRVLEPSAGVGNIADPLRHRTGAYIACVEKFPPHVAKLRTLPGLDVIEGNFLDMHASEIGLYDRILLNPPFSKRQDIAHVLHAWELLGPGGKLVAIMSAGVEFRQDKLAQRFRDEVMHNHGTLERLPDGSFKESGTMVRTVLVTMAAG
jgi:predicted RNA methylase